jgi:O-methyltransferase involved in polyketide biosynthesis
MMTCGCAPAVNWQAAIPVWFGLKALSSRFAEQLVNNTDESIKQRLNLGAGSETRALRGFRWVDVGCSTGLPIFLPLLLT